MWWSLRGPHSDVDDEIQGQLRPQAIGGTCRIELVAVQMHQEAHAVHHLTTT